MTPHDPGYCYRQRQAVFRRRRLTVVLVACVIALGVLAFTGPSDAQIEGNQSTEAIQ